MKWLIEKLEDLFSYSGRIGRLKYFFYGIVIPFGLIIIALIANALLTGEEFDPDLDFNSTMGVLLLIITFIAAISIQLSAVIRRSRDTTFSTTLGVVSFFLLQYIGMLILLVAPSYEGETKPESSKFGKAIHMFYGVILIIIILGVIAAVVVPKLADTRNEAKVIQEKVSSEKQINY